jgi:glutamate racemase
MYVEPLIDKGADTLVLGCTHFPLVKQIIRKYSPPGTTIIDPSASVASELKRQLYDKGLLRAQQEGSVTLLKTGENDNFNLFTKDLLGSANQPSPLNL